MKNILLSFILISIFACSSSKPDLDQQRPDYSFTSNQNVERLPLSDRGWSSSTRNFYADKKLKTAPERIKQAFIDKKLTRDMTKDLVNFMFDQPNIYKGDSIWFYLDSSNDTLLKIHFQAEKAYKWSQKGIE